MVLLRCTRRKTQVHVHDHVLTLLLIQLQVKQDVLRKATLHTKDTQLPLLKQRISKTVLIVVPNTESANTGVLKVLILGTAGSRQVRRDEQNVVNGIREIRHVELRKMLLQSSFQESEGNVESQNDPLNMWKQLNKSALSV